MKDDKKYAESETANVVERNIRALLEHRKKEEQNKSKEEQIAAAITRFTGNMLFVYIHIFFFGGWILWNSGILGNKPFDPSFVMLAVVASVETIFLSTFVLISQNRMNIQADKRADLHLQIGLLTEHEVTHIITMVNAIAKKMNIEDADHPDIENLKKDVHPVNIMDTMEKHMDDYKDVLK